MQKEDRRVNEYEYKTEAANHSDLGLVLKKPESDGSFFIRFVDMGNFFSRVSTEARIFLWGSLSLFF